MADLNYEFDNLSDVTSSIIKVIGVGGGGGNAVNHMYKQGIKGVEFFVCNTDRQALEISPVPKKIQLGVELTSGLGAGAKPEVGKEAAVESKQEIKDILSNNTKMLFITAGMGGGTGTGAAPIIAEIAKELGILTVGIITMPFGFEGKPKFRRAEIGLEELKSYCDTVLVILNNKLKDVYGKATMKEAFSQADNVLLNGAKSIAEIITVSGTINVDFEDVRTVMQDSGAAVMGSATAEGENRARRAAEGAVTSPLLNDTNIYGAKYILLSIVIGNEDDFQMDELEEITEFVTEQAGDDAEVIFGQATDESLGDAIGVTIIATGFNREENENDADTRTVFDLESTRRIKPTFKASASTDFFDRASDDEIEGADEKKNVIGKQREITFELEGNYEIVEETEDEKKEKALKKQFENRKNALENLKSVGEMSNEELKEKQDIPAYQRKDVKLINVPHSSERNISKFKLNEDNEILGDNKFLHDNVD